MKVEERFIPDLLSILDKSFGIAINANDFFSYATSDMVLIDPLDLVWVLTICEKYPKSGIDACIAFIRKAKPLEPWITAEYELAYAELEKLNPEIHSEQ